MKEVDQLRRVVEHATHDGASQAKALAGYDHGFHGDASVKDTREQFVGTVQVRHGRWGGRDELCITVLIGKKEEEVSRFLQPVVAGDVTQGGQLLRVGHTNNAVLLGKGTGWCMLRSIH